MRPLKTLSIWYFNVIPPVLHPEGSNIQLLQATQAHLEAAAEELVQEKHLLVIIKIKEKSLACTKARRACHWVCNTCLWAPQKGKKPPAAESSLPWRPITSYKDWDGQEHSPIKALWHHNTVFRMEKLLQHIKWHQPKKFSSTESSCLVPASLQNKLRRPSPPAVLGGNTASHPHPQSVFA